ncbi:MAG: DUF3341 domain-containing protein [Sumerlaeia bacterium]
MASLPRRGFVGFFNDPDEFIHAAAEAKSLGLKKLDGYSPFPIHGAEELFDIGPSWVPRAALTGLFIGATLGFLLQWWTHSVDWPINVGGKPMFAWPAYVVIIFESAVLLAGLTNFLAIFISCGLFPNPFAKTLDPDLTNDRFALVIPTRNPDDVTKAEALLKRMKADEIRSIGL